MTIHVTIDAPQTPGALFKNGCFVIDNWRRLEEHEAIPEGGEVLLPLSRFLQEAEGGGLPPAALGVVLAPGDRVVELLPHLDLLSVIAIDFPKFSDGRGFSHAALLARHGFKGEVRAIGDVLIDQIPFMKRLRFTAFEINHAVTRRYLLEGTDPAPKRYYQPAALAEPIAGSRPWLRQMEGL